MSQVIELLTLLTHVVHFCSNDFGHDRGRGKSTGADTLGI